MNIIKIVVMLCVDSKFKRLSFGTIEAYEKHLKIAYTIDTGISQK